MTDILQDDQFLYEIIELTDGDVALCRAGDNGPEGEPLLRIHFSEESRYFLENTLEDAHMEVAKAMIEAGLAAFQELQAITGGDSDSEELTHIVH